MHPCTRWQSLCVLFVLCSGESFVPKPDLLSLMGDIGMSQERAYRSLQATGNSSVEAALEWLEKHQDDAGTCGPLFVCVYNSSCTCHNGVRQLVCCALACCRFG